MAEKNPAGKGAAGNDRQQAQRRGRWAESLAAWLLRLKGYRILARNYRTKVGEIDLIARRGSCLVFVEVKRRAGREQGLTAITPRQRQRIARAAEHFLAGYRGGTPECLRFDAVLIGATVLPQHIVGAWQND